ncbi:rod shape-determining protein MreC [Burkholderia glumae]|uniref:Cell shape-determining protein MreC n=1 Tax=Burkholderia glumae TaxID=337 RepID=A0AAQ0BRU8_BURGL|nr:rod shape-determining protein MreC [Burkholderia glumae]ACR30457.1 Rod shape-determining protein MreC [Burkholderia glumae BGR1]AJY67474.1 rod shape-determining protein MreC [Burkholderia glumae LMG 2196 = ATCC 33617]KHJ63052.1 rod shape-determining protein MreC [Burkholderia glumae]MCM2481891.1 rod shape-determining protein MreC [Burkholderia glumae]MCM2507966.1 rod shape-determining protein MreC [Burkholderia glumae]
MEYSPPPLFKQGPSALARLIFFVALAIALLVSDARFSTLEIVRGILGTALYPLQRAALVPRDLFMGAADLAATNASLRHDNQQLHQRNLALSLQANQAAQLAADNAHLRAVLGLRARIAVQATPVELQYDTSDPFSQKVVIGRGSHDDIQNGAPVVTEDGVIGQVTRVFPLQAEITLVTDRDLAIPVQVLRTGLRSVIYGTPKGDSLDLRFVPTSADLLVGDELVTSGLDGLYPPGLPVAKVVRIDKLADTAFAHVVCMPIAAVRGAREMLVLHYQNDLPPRPVDPDPAADKNAKGKKGAKTADKGKGDENGRPAAAASGAGSAEKPAEKPTDKPAEKPGEKPAGKSGEKPAGKSAAPAAARPAARPAAPAAAPSRGAQP